MYAAIIVILIIFSALFSSTETAFASANRIRLKNYASQGNKRAKKAIVILDGFDRALTAILVGNNIVNILSTSLATVMFTKYFGESSVGLATLVMTVLVLLFGEILPKSFASENSERVALGMAPFLYAFMILLKPLLFVITKLKNLVTRLLGTKSYEPTVTEEELKYIIDEIEDEGVLEEQESDLVRSALEFDEISINDILIPRVNVEAVEIGDSLDEIREKFISTKFSRLPVYAESVDNVVGILHQSDFYEMYLSKDKGTLSGILKKPLYVSEYQKISITLKEMQRHKIHMAVVIDEYGGTKGIVTLEDVIEELVGEIYDESDEEDTSFISLGNGCYEVSADLSINDFLDRTDLPEDAIDSECTSLGGWFMDILDRVPQYGNIVKTGRFTLKAIKVDDQKLERIFIKIDGSPEDFIKDGEASKE